MPPSRMPRLKSVATRLIGFRWRAVHTLRCQMELAEKWSVSCKCTSSTCEEVTMVPRRNDPRRKEHDSRTLPSTCRGGRQRKKTSKSK
eukprot:scaffold52330_cov69-Phaeocystis_antarctica.AAC.1